MKLKIRFINLIAAFLLATPSLVKCQVTTAKSTSVSSHELKNFSDIIPENAKVRHGLFTIYKVDEKYYYEIPDSLLGREMLVLTRLVKTPVNLHVTAHQYGGEQENKQLWKWEKHDRQIFIRVPSYASIADTNSTMYRAVQNSNLPVILASFPILSHGKNGTGYVIDVTDFYAGDLEAIGISEDIKKAFKISSLDASRSYIDTIKSFPTNIEARETKTYRAASSPTDNTTAAITFQLDNSMILLPKIPLKPRILDARLIYRNNDVVDYGDGSEQAEPISYITRWRLEPKDEAAYERGELVEPKKPIVIYIDPATPAKWVPYFIAGINDWQKAFEAAGFKNAIIAKPAPTAAEDPDFDMDDARYSVFRYFASDISNAYGQINADPRTGEIVESYIGWYSNQLIDSYNWYFVQTAAANPLARVPVLPDEIMGQLLRFTICHEMGHSLGLPHNWGANYAYPTDSLRSRTFTDKHGTAASIMDYARFNYVAQPGDGVRQFLPKIGEYDIWAIKWGYTWFPANKTVAEEKETLDKWVKERAGDPKYFFGQEFTSYDPRTQNEDIGDNAMKAGTYGIANLKRIVPNIEKWTYEKDKDFSKFKQVYNELLLQYRRYMGHVVTNVGGEYVNHKTYDQTNIVGFTFVDKSTQHQAVSFLNENVFRTQLWLLDKQELRDVDNGIIPEDIKTIQASVLTQLFAPSRLARIFDDELKNGNTAYTLNDLFNDVRPTIFNGENPDAFTRTLERKYIAVLWDLLTTDPKPDDPELVDGRAAHGHTPINVPMSDIRPLVRAELKRINKLLPVGKDKVSIAHFDDLHVRINEALTPVKTVANVQP